MKVSLWQTGGGFYHTFRAWVSEEFARLGWTVAPLPARGRAADVGDLVFSMNFSPELARLAKAIHKPYVCWIWDALVNFNLLNPAWASDYTILFHFAPSDLARFRQAGYRHCYYLPSSTHHLSLQRQAATVGEPVYPIVFAGNCYRREQALYAGYREAAMRQGAVGESTVAIMDQFLAWVARHPACRLRDAFADFARQALPAFFEMAPVPGPQWRGPLDKSLDFFVNTLLYHESDLRIRSTLVQTLATLGIALWGEEAGWKPHLGEGITLHPLCHLESDMGAVLASGKIALNLSRNISDGANMRTFEIPAAGAFQLALYSDEMARLFDPGKEIVLFHTPEEAHDLAAFYLMHEAARQPIALAGQARFLRDHTLPQRFTAMARMLAACGIK